jgi:hypothetical protein
MLTISNKPFETQSRWERTQQPIHSSSQPADNLRLLAALDAGWQITETADFLAHGMNAEGRGYLLTLYNPRLHLTREMNTMHSPEMDALLAFEGVPGFQHQTTY